MAERASCLVWKRTRSVHSLVSVAKNASMAALSGSRPGPGGFRYVPGPRDRVSLASSAGPGPRLHGLALGLFTSLSLRPGSHSAFSRARASACALFFRGSHCSFAVRTVLSRFALLFAVRACSFAVRAAPRGPRPRRRLGKSRHHRRVIPHSLPARVVTRQPIGAPARFTASPPPTTASAPERSALAVGATRLVLAPGGTDGPINCGDTSAPLCRARRRSRRAAPWLDDRNRP